MKQFVKKFWNNWGLVIVTYAIGLLLSISITVDAGNPQKKNPIAEYPQCQTQLNTFQTIDKQIRAMPRGEVPSTMIEKKVDAWKAYKACVKQQKKVEKKAKDFNSMQPADQTELQQQLNTVRPQ